MIAAKDAGVATIHQKFLKNWLPTRPTYSLETRLRRLCEDTGLGARWIVSAVGMAKLRNDLGHGNAASDANTLPEAYRQGFAPARMLVLQQLAIVPPRT